MKTPDSFSSSWAELQRFLTSPGGSRAPEKSQQGSSGVRVLLWQSVSLVLSPQHCATSNDGLSCWTLCLLLPVLLHPPVARGAARKAAAPKGMERAGVSLGQALGVKPQKCRANSCQLSSQPAWKVKIPAHDGWNRKSSMRALLAKPALDKSSPMAKGNQEILVSLGILISEEDQGPY